jgi:hypothetical protein
MDKPHTTPKDFFLWAGAMIALYSGVTSFISLIFQYIDYAFPDATFISYNGDPYQSGVSYAMASLIVLAPLFLVLMRVIRRDIVRDPSRGELWVRRWALYLVLFVAGSSIVIDLIVLFTTFLSGGELTTRFLLKVLLVFLVASAGFMHFVADVRGFWQKFPERARYINWGVAILVVLVILSGFVIVGTPQQARQARIDAQRIYDLDAIQQNIVYFYEQKTRLPKDLQEMNDPLRYTVPVDPQTKAAYDYLPTTGTTFQLCATFTSDSRGRGLYTSNVPALGMTGNEQSNWLHGIGKTCFLRTIDPDFLQVDSPASLKPVPAR